MYFGCGEWYVDSSALTYHGESFKEKQTLENPRYVKTRDDVSYNTFHCTYKKCAFVHVREQGEVIH